MVVHSFPKSMLVTILIMCLFSLVLRVSAENPLKITHIPLIEQSQYYNITVTGLTEFESLKELQPQGGDYVDFDFLFTFSGLTIRPDAVHSTQTMIKIWSGQRSTQVQTFNLPNVVNLDTYKTTLKIGPWSSGGVYDGAISLSLLVDGVDFNNSKFSISATVVKTGETQTSSVLVPKAKSIAQNFSFHYTDLDQGISNEIIHSHYSRGLQGLNKQINTSSSNPSSSSLQKGFFFEFEKLTHKPTWYFALTVNDTQIRSPPGVFNSRSGPHTYCYFINKESQNTLNSSSGQDDPEPVGTKVLAAVYKSIIRFYWELWYPEPDSSYRVECPAVYLDFSHAEIRPYPSRFVFGLDPTYSTILYDEMSGVTMEPLP